MTFKVIASGWRRTLSSSAVRERLIGREFVRVNNAGFDESPEVDLTKARYARRLSRQNRTNARTKLRDGTLRKRQDISSELKFSR